MDEIKKTIIGKDVKKLESSSTPGGDVQLGLENSLLIPQKDLYRITIWPSISTPRCKPRELKTDVYPKTCTQMFRAALFTITKKQKQSKCPLIDEQTNKMWYIHPMAYYSTMKKNDMRWSVDKPWKHYAKCNMLVTKDPVLCDSLLRKCPEWAN